MKFHQGSQLEIRDIRFDVLKVIGLLCIILAHTDPLDFVMYIRSFDVPLMVIISGALFHYSSHKKKYSFWAYVKKRIPRLVAPTWTFLLLFFSATYIIFSVAGKSYPFSMEKIFSSFALLTGIGYVWIIRVFILVSVVSLLLLRMRWVFLYYQQAND